MGNPDQGPQRRPQCLQVEFLNKLDRNIVKQACQNLNDIPEMKDIICKADLSKEERNAYTRIFKLRDDLIKNNPDAVVRYDKGKLYMNEEEIDKFKTSSTVF